jgi:SAM-dependent methyltransferase
MNRFDLYPHHDTYAALYARYFKRGPEALLGTDRLDGMTVLDLCGGGGRLSVYAARLGARVHYVDLERAMIPTKLLSENRISWTCHSAQDALTCYKRDKTHFGQHVETQFGFDIIACQQGINYWLCDDERWNGDLVAACLKPGGLFIFNTFNTDPGTTPKVKDYEYGGHHFVEVSYRIDDMIYHTQARDGIAPHMTRFRWLSPDSIKEHLEPWFATIEQQDGPTSIWTCKRMAA